INILFFFFLQNFLFFVNALTVPKVGGRSAERPYCRAQPKISKQKSQSKRVDETVCLLLIL
ncbi:MAG: hypothetical protein ACOCNG_08160, partial [Bacteroidales bacterium]